MSGEQPSPWKDFGDVGALGIELVLSVFFATGVGYWLDGRLGTSPWLTIVGAVLGLAAGMRSAYRVIVKSDFQDKSGKD